MNRKNRSKKDFTWVHDCSNGHCFSFVKSPGVVSLRTAYCGLSRLCGSSQTCRSSPASWESPGPPVEDSDQQQKPNFSAQPAHWPDASCSQLFSVSSPDLFAVYQPERGCNYCPSSLYASLVIHLDFGHLFWRERLEVCRVFSVGCSARRTQPIAFRPDFVPTKPTNLRKEDMMIIYLYFSSTQVLPDTRTSTDKSCSRRVLGTPYREDIPVPRHRWGWVQTSLHWD